MAGGNTEIFKLTEVTYLVTKLIITPTKNMLFHTILSEEGCFKNLLFQILCEKNLAEIYFRAFSLIFCMTGKKMLRV